MTKKRVTMTDADYRGLAEFRRALRDFLAFSEKAAARAGLTPAQHQALLAIRGMPGPVTVGTLATWLGVPAQNLPTVFPTIGNFSTTDLGFLG